MGSIIPISQVRKLRLIVNHHPTRTPTIISPGVITPHHVDRFMYLFSLCNCDSLRAKTASLSLVHFLAQRIVPNTNVSWKKEQMRRGEDLQGHATEDSGAGQRSWDCVIPRPMVPRASHRACYPGQSSQQEAQPFSRGGLFLSLKKPHKWPT